MISIHHSAVYKGHYYEDRVKHSVAVKKLEKVEDEHGMGIWFVLYLFVMF